MLTFFLDFLQTCSRGVATNRGLGKPWSKITGSFCIVKTNKTLMFLHRVNNVEHNIKQNIYTGMEVICLTSMILYIKTVRMKIY